MKVSIEFPWYSPNKDEELVFEIYGTYIPYVPARINDIPERCYPAEGDYVEDFEFKLIEHTKFKDGNSILIDHSDDERKLIESNFESTVLSNTKLLEKLQEAFKLSINEED